MAVLSDMGRRVPAIPPLSVHDPLFILVPRSGGPILVAVTYLLRRSFNPYVAFPRPPHEVRTVLQAL